VTSLADTTPPRTLGVAAGVAILVGVVLGVGVFRAPQVVALNVTSEAAYIGLWLLGGAITLIGALCYAELGSAYPHEGGEYHFLSRAYGRPTALMFAWARGAVIQPGAIAAVAFVYGDYMARIAPLGEFGPAWHAASAVAALTGLNLAGTLQSKTAQITLTLVDLAALGALIVAGLAFGEPGAGPAASAAPANPAAGLALVFVLLTYGGWNEAAYLGGEVRRPERDMLRILAIGVGVVIVVYTLANYAYLRGLGLEGLRAADAPGAELMRQTLGEGAAAALAAGVAVAALSTLNGTLFTGARTFAALGRDLPALGRLAVWSAHGKNPRGAILVQGLGSLLLVGLGGATREGFQAMVDYTAPVFWGFMLLCALSLFVLRRRDPATARPFRAPLYPLTPAIFALSCAGLLYSSLAYTGAGALWGVAILALGLPLLLLKRS